MKKYILTLALLALTAVGLQAQNVVTVTNYVTVTNVVSPLEVTSTNTMPEFNKVDFTLSSAGTSYGGNNQAGIDFSLSINPFEKLPQVWVGVSQGLYWSPTFGGSTDVDIDWNVNLTDKLCVLGGWSFGDVYGAGVENLLRTGPEVIAQYYLDDHVYLYGAVNYDLLTKQGGQNWTSSNSDNNGWRWSIGFGVEF